MRVPVRKMFSPLACIGTAMVMALVATTLAMPQAALASGNDQVCQPQDDHIEPDGNYTEMTVTAPAGKVITGYCVKAGSANSGNGPEYVDGLNATEVTFSHSSGKDISHYVVFYGDADDNNWEYADPTCTSLYVDFPDWVNAGAANHVNIRFSGNGETFTLNWHTAGSWAPESAFVYADHPDWPDGLTVFTVEWVQVAETNYHWEGELECGDDPEPTLASGSLTIECVVDTTYKGTVSVTAGDQLDENGKLHWKVAVVGEGRLFDGRLDPFQTFGPVERELELTPGSTVILAQKASVTGTEVRLDEVTVPPACPADAPSADLTYATECDAGVVFRWTNTGNVDLDVVRYINDAPMSVLTSNAGAPGGWDLDHGLAVNAGDVVKVELSYGDVVIASEEVTYAGECPQPVGDLVIECVVNNDYRISGSVTATDAGLAWGLGNRAPFLRLDGGRIGANVTDSFDDVYTLTPGSTVFLREQGAGSDWIASRTVPEGCPIAPTGDISIKCFEDDLYDVAAEIDGGSVGVKWMIRIKGGGGIVTKGSVPAFDNDTIFLPAKQLEQGLVLVLRAPDNGGKLDSVTVPTSCFAPVSDALIALDTECDAEAEGSITNVGETTLLGNVYINDEVLPGDIEIGPGETEEFILLAELLEEGDVVKLIASGPEGYEREQTVTYPEPCPTTTTVPPTTTVPTTTTVPPTTTVVVETPTTVPTTTVPETTTTVPDTTTTTPDDGGTVAETPSAEPVEQTPTFTG